MSPDDRKYTKEHEWIKVEDAQAARAVVGITEYAQDQLGDVVYFDLPKPGDALQSQQKMGEVESVKAVSDLFSPVSGRVIEINTDLLDHPELVNEVPFEKGWILRVTMTNASEIDGLLSMEDYESFIGGL